MSARIPSINSTEEQGTLFREGFKLSIRIAEGRDGDSKVEDAPGAPLLFDNKVGEDHSTSCGVDVQ